MNRIELKMLLDACITAKRTLETMPELPKGMKPRHIHVLEAVYEIRAQGLPCRVSDVSTALDTTTPSITKLIQELELLGMLNKTQNPQDKRVTELSLTEKGSQCVQQYVIELHTKWADALSDISGEQVLETVHTIKRLRESMPENS